MEETTYNYAETKTDGTTFDLRTNVDADVRQPPVFAQYGCLTRELEMLGETVAKLRVQLEPVLGPDVPRDTNGEKNGATPTLSPFAESIRSDAARVVEIHSSLRAIMHRIEV